MTILFLINSIDPGGAERAVINLLRYLPNIDQELKLVLYLLEEPENPYPVPDHVEVRTAGEANTSHLLKFLKIFPLAVQLKRFIKKRKIGTVISILSRANYVNVIARYLGADHRCLITEMNVPSQIYRTAQLSDLLNRYLKRALYREDHSYLAISQGIKDDLIENFNVIPEKITVIHNMVDIEEIQQKLAEKIEHPWLSDKEIKTILTVGRLEKPKNHPLLLHAFKKTVNFLPEARLIILGEGSYRERLIALARELKIDSKVAFSGFCRNPFSYMSQADVFVLSSDTEGFGNVIIEAMVCGCPVISTDCPSGPGEIITDGVNGVLVPVNDADAMSDAIISLLRDNQRRQMLIMNAAKRALDFSLPLIARQYYQQLKNPV